MFWLRKIKLLVVLQKRVNDHEDERGSLETTEVHTQQLIKKNAVFLCKEHDKSAVMSQCEFSPNTRIYHLKPERNN